MASPDKRRDPNVSIRLWPELTAELQPRTARGASRSELINQFAVEGLRMDAHPGLVFRSGPAGRRPGLHGGPDVWEIARVIREIEPRGEQALPATAAQMGLPVEMIEIAVRYYAAYAAEIDAWIEMVDAEADWLEAAWKMREQVLE